MKKSLFFALLACATLAFVGCDKKNPVNPGGGDSEAWTVKIDATELYLEKGTTHKLTAVVTPSSSKAIEWTSDNPEVATVNASGIVEAVDFGTAVITATIDASDVTPATCVVNVTNDAVLNTFELGGYALWDLGSPIAGTDKTLTLSDGTEVTVQLAPSLYYVWDKGIVLVSNRLSGAGYLMPVENYTYVITDSPKGVYNGYYIGNFDIVVDDVEDALAYSSDSAVYAGLSGKLLDVEMYGDAWDAILNFPDEPTEEEINAAYDLYYASQTGTQFFHIDLNTGSQSYYYGNVSYLYLTEDKATGELYYALKLEWYDHVNVGRWFGLLAETELNEEDGKEYITGFVKPYDMRTINKEYLVLPPAEDEEEPAEVKAIEIKKPIRFDAKQTELLKSTTRMYKK
jgi:hypothetical protein